MLKNMILQHPKNAIFICLALWIVMIITIFIKSLQFIKSVHHAGTIIKTIDGFPVKETHPNFSREITTEAKHITKIVGGLFTFLELLVIAFVLI